jgi:hypothetical protein
MAVKLRAGRTLGEPLDRWSVDGDVALAEADPERAGDPVRTDEGPV